MSNAKCYVRLKEYAGYGSPQPHKKIKFTDLPFMFTEGRWFPCGDSLKKYILKYDANHQYPKFEFITPEEKHRIDKKARMDAMSRELGYQVREDELTFNDVEDSKAIPFNETDEFLDLKAELQDLGLERKEEKEEVVEEDSSPNLVKYTEGELSSMKKSSLIELAKEEGLEDPTRMNKQSLVAALMEV